MRKREEIELPPEPPLESKDVLVSKVIKLHESFRALLDDHAIPILRQTEYVHTGAYALEALVNALSGTTLQCMCERGKDILKRRELDMLLECMTMAIRSVRDLKLPTQREPCMRYIMFMRQVSQMCKRVPRTFNTKFGNDARNLLDDTRHLKSSLKNERAELSKSLRTFLLRSTTTDRDNMDLLSSLLEAVYSQNMPTELENSCKEKVRTTLEDALSKSFPGCKLNAYGSSANHLCFSGSDIDTCLCFGETPPKLSVLSERFPKLIDKEEENKTNETAEKDPLRDCANSEAVFKKLLEAEYKSSKCFYCRETGHTARDCPKRKAEMDKRTKELKNTDEGEKEEKEEEMSETLSFATVHYNQWRNWLRREHFRDNENGDDPKEYSEELLTKFRMSQIEFAKERSMKRHVVVCCALDLCKDFNIASPLDDDDDDHVNDDTKNLPVNIQDISVLISARVPILKVTGVTLSEGTPPIDVDICVENPLGIYNTALLKCYADYDPRVRPLMMIVKYWAKQRSIKDASNATLSSYCYVLMVIFYLQQIGILPCLQDKELVGEKWKRDLIEGCDVSACLDADEARTFFEKNDKNDEEENEKKKNVFLSVLDDIDEEDSVVDGSPKTKFARSAGVSNLLVGFFQFYHHTFKYEGSVVCVRTGEIMNKNDYRPGERGVPSWRISVEDPFETDHDLGNVIRYRESMDLINHEFRRGCELGQLLDTNQVLTPQHIQTWFSKLTETRDTSSFLVSFNKLSLNGESEKDWSLNEDKSSECFVCGKNDHSSRECPSHTMLDELKMGPQVCFNCLRIGHVSRDCQVKRCFRCNQLGHEKRDCPRAGGGRRKKKVTCYHCGKEGHVSRDCPKKKRSGGGGRRNNRNNGRRR